MSAALERVLELVAEGKLSAEEAAPILDALEQRMGSSVGQGASDEGAERHDPASGERQVGRTARIEVFERGKRRVNLRIPLSLGRVALARVPGLSGEQIDQVRAAIAGGQLGPILDVEDDDGDGVRIVVE